MAEILPIDLSSLVLAQAGGGGGDLLSMLGPFILLMAGMWFLLIAPQRKMQKQHEKLISELKVGDEILTKGGIYGTVTNVKAERLTIKVSENTKIDLAKPYIQSVVKKKGEKAKNTEAKDADEAKEEEKSDSAKK
ncbi:MAG: preprotein translocase subunit YajC [Puniceicoccales bacterium]